MAKDKKEHSHKSASGLPLAPCVYINNSLDTSLIYAEALSSLIPQSGFCGYNVDSTPISAYRDPYAVSIHAGCSSLGSQAAKRARGCQVMALERGCNMACIALCNDSTITDFLAVKEKEWPANHITINIDGLPVEEVAKKIMKWLFTVLSVRETLYLIPESEMLTIDTKNYPDYKYSSLKNASKHDKGEKVQFVALIASKPEITEPNKLTWTVVDRSGEAKFYFHYRGLTSQATWNWVLNLQLGERRALPRMPMVALHEPLGKKFLLSPLRITGATVRGVGHLTIGLGKGVHWIGDKVSVRRSEDDRYIPHDQYEETMRKKAEDKELQKGRKMGARAFGKLFGALGSRVAYCGTKNAEPTDEQLGDWYSTPRYRKAMMSEKDKGTPQFKIFNEKGEKTWTDTDQVSTTTTTATTTRPESLVDEKCVKEFC